MQATYGGFILSEIGNRSAQSPDLVAGLPCSASLELNLVLRRAKFLSGNEEIADKIPLFEFELDQFCKIHPVGHLNYIWVTGSETDGRSRAFLLEFGNESSFSNFGSMVAKLKESSPVDSGSLDSRFDRKIEPASAKMYFHYYGQLLHQQNMLQDYVRTGTYYAAVVENKIDFEDKVVMDVGAGSGILSLFAAQAGARHVYAVEASPMAEYAKKLALGNPAHAQRITVLHGKVEEVEVPEKVDILISEPMGTLLVNERMLESYVIARDRFLVPGGKMFPSLGRIHVAPFSDEVLFAEIANRALFWQQTGFYDVDLTPLHSDAFRGYFSQPVVDAFDPRLLVAPAVSHTIDFTTSKEEDLFDIDIPLCFTSSSAGRVHGLACWFDVLFNGSAVPRWLTTAPGAPTTHWYQIRCVLMQPIYVMIGQEIRGKLRMVAHSAQSYTIHLTLSAMSTGGASRPLQTSKAEFDLKEPYYRLSQSTAYNWGQESQQGAAMETDQVAVGAADDANLQNTFNDWLQTDR